MALVLSSCVIAGPPDYKDPTQTPPVLDLSQADPPLGFVVQATSDQTTIPISVPVRSQDPPQNGLFGMLYLDFKSPNQTLYSNFWSSDPKSFDDTTRTVTFNWTPANVSAGCHTLTIEVTHRLNVSFQGQPTVTPPKDHPDDIAFATWWVDVHPGSPNSDLSDCPKSSP